jgi:hypothetical protein
MEHELRETGATGATGRPIYRTHRMYRFNNPELGWYIIFEGGIRRVCRIIRGDNYDTVDIFYTEPVNTTYEGENITWTQAYDHDMRHYGHAGSYWRHSYGYPVIDQYIWSNCSPERRGEEGCWMRVNFVGDYTIDMVEAFPDENININQEVINHQGNEIF